MCVEEGIIRRGSCMYQYVRCLCPDPCPSHPRSGSRAAASVLPRSLPPSLAQTWRLSAPRPLPAYTAHHTLTPRLSEAGWVVDPIPQRRKARLRESCRKYSGSHSGSPLLLNPRSFHNPRQPPGSPSAQFPAHSKSSASRFSPALSVSSLPGALPSTQPGAS